MRGVGVKLLMRMSDDWGSFMEKMDEYYPPFGKTLRLPFGSGVNQLPKPNKEGSEQSAAEKPLRRI